jgi:transposase
MDAVSSEAKRRNQLLDLDSLDVESLKALVLAKQTEIENLSLLVLKLKRMHFGQRSEKMSADIEQLELRLEDLEANQAAPEPLPDRGREREARKEARTPSATRRTAA